LAVEALRGGGYTVLSAASGEEALEVARAHDAPLHMLVTDVIMPGMNGRQLADELAERRPGLRVLYVSGYTRDVIAHHGVVETGVDLLEKPYSRLSLLRRVRAALDRALP
jgi:CheY-like chemotaxis protein